MEFRNKKYILILKEIISNENTYIFWTNTLLISQSCYTFLEV